MRWWWWLGVSLQWQGSEFVTHTHTHTLTYQWSAVEHQNMEDQVGDSQLELSKVVVVQSGFKKDRQAGCGVKETQPLFIRHPAEAIS